MKTFHKAPLVLAVTALMVAPVAFAQEAFTATSSVTSTFMNEIDVSITHTADSTRTIAVTGTSDFSTDDYAGALVDSKQFSEYNDVTNYGNTNEASVGEGAEGAEGAMSGASGNIGVNVAAGDANNQANDAALATSDAASVFGQSAAFAAQTAAYNSVTNAESSNSASLGGSALSGASGNIGVNIVAGVGNSQQNSLAASTGTATGSVEATAGGVQQTHDNIVSNGVASLGEQEVEFNLALDASNLKMDQIGDVYLDMWEPAQGETVDSNSPHLHSAGQTAGHIDVDSEAQYAQDLNGDGGAFAFGATPDSLLAGTVSGVIPVATIENAQHANTASLGGGALAGASGNIGVNIASGSNNLQRNSLSIASVTGGGGGELQ